MNETRCEGWTRNGGAFTLGPVEWSQCKNTATVMLKLRNPDEKKAKTMPACQECWDKALDKRWGIKVLSATPIIRKKIHLSQKGEGK